EDALFGVDLEDSESPIHDPQRSGDIVENTLDTRCTEADHDGRLLDIGVGLAVSEGETGVIDGTELRGPLSGGLVAVAMHLTGRDDDVAVDRVLTVRTACPEASNATTGEVVNALERVAVLARIHVRGRDRFRTVDRKRQEGEPETRHTHVIGQIPQLAIRIRHTC